MRLDDEDDKTAPENNDVYNNHNVVSVTLGSKEE